MGETLYYVEERNLFFIVHISGQKGLDCSKKDMKNKRDRPPLHSREQSFQIIVLDERELNFSTSHPRIYLIDETPSG
jgi:hypothetical protein